MRAKAKSRYRLFQTEKGSDRTREIGVVTLSDDHKLRLVSAASDRREFLDKLVARTNGDDVLHVIAAPPPEAERFAVYTRPVPRSNAGFRKALLDHLKSRYAVELKPA
jgi:hypothetical protein